MTFAIANQLQLTNILREHRNRLRALEAGPRQNIVTNNFFPIELHAEAFLAAPATLDYQNVPQDFEGIIVVMELLCTTGGGQQAGLRFNNDSGTHYRWNWGYGSGGAAAATWDGGVLVSEGRFCSVPQTGADTLAPANAVLTMSGYAAATLRQTFVCSFGQNNTFFRAGTASGMWNQLAAVNRLQFFTTSGTPDTGSRWTFYFMPNLASTPRVG